jgi:hypothetical protein
LSARVLKLDSNLQIIEDKSVISDELTQEIRDLVQELKKVRKHNSALDKLV